jgi:hypothetical protein
LLKVERPDGVKAGTTYRLSIHQVDGATGRVIGAFDVSIPVSKAELILDEEARTLSVLKHVLTTIPPTNRWYPVFQLYVTQLAAKVDALGGDAGAVHPNPDGSGRPVEPSPGGGCRPRDLCELVTCLLSKAVVSRELEARLRDAGVNLDAVRRCVRRACEED